MSRQSRAVHIFTVVMAMFLAIPQLRADEQWPEFWDSQPAAISERYYEAEANFEQDWVIEFADSLMRVSDKTPADAPMKYYAAALKCHYAFNQLDSANFFAYSNQAQEYALKYRLIPYYFSELMNVASFHMNMGYMREAELSAKKILKRSRELDFPKGLFYGYYSLGFLYSQRDDHRKAIDAYESAIDVISADDQNLAAIAQCQSYIAFELLDLKEYDKAIEMAEVSKVNNTPDNDSDAAIALAYFYKGDTDEFRTVGQRYLDAVCNSSFSYSYFSSHIEALIFALDGKFEQAIRNAESVDNKWTVLSEVYQLKGDWKNAFECQEKANADRQESVDEMLSEDAFQLEEDIKDIISSFSEQKKQIIMWALLVVVLTIVIAAFTLSFVFLQKNRHIVRLQKEELKISNEYRLLIETAPVGYSKAKLILDENGRVCDYRTVEVNRTLRIPIDNAGVRLGERTIMESYPQSGPILISKINEALDSEAPYVRFSYHLREFDKYYETILLLDTPGYVKIISLNITELVRARKDAEESSRIKTRFVQNMSHEIRTPLNAIVGFAQILALPEGAVSEEERETYATFVKDNSDFLLMLIDDILDISDAEGGHYRMSIASHSCNDICRASMSIVESRVPEGVEFRFKTNIPDSHTLTTDGRRIQQVLVNYLTNACKHTKEGFVELSCSNTEIPGKVVFAVADTGPGIPPEKAEVIFDRFVKLDEFKQGTGLGLNICKTIAEKLGAELKLDNSYTSGARFLFIIDDKVS